MSENATTVRLREVRGATDVPLQKIATLSGLSLSVVSKVANAKPGQVFAPDTERAINEALDDYLHDLVADASALLGDDDPDIAAVVDRISRRRRR